MALLDFEKLVMSSDAARLRPEVARAMVKERKEKGNGSGACVVLGEASPLVASVCSGAVPSSSGKGD